MFENFFKDKKILVTGHTGFQGSWLVLWLKLLGADVIGYSLPPPTKPSLFESLEIKNDITHIIADIRNLDELKKAISSNEPDLIFHLEETFPFRPDGFIDSMINNLLVDGYDSVVAARRETGWIWQENARGNLERIDSGDVPREFKEQSFVGLHGLGCVTHPEFVRRGNLLGNKTGLFKIDNLISSFEVRDENSSFIASQLI